MTREAKLRYHLEMVVVRDYLGVLLTGAEITALADRATPEQHETAFERAW